MEEAAHVVGWKDVNFILFSVTVFKNFNGLLILPVLSGITQMLMTKLNPATAQPEGNNQQADQQKGMNAFMKYFFPIFSVFICLTSNAGFALYWVTINIFATVQSIVLNKYLDYKDAKDEKLVKTEGKGSVK